MSEKEDDYDPQVAAIQYGCIETTSLFEGGLPSFKYQTTGINIRIPWVQIITFAIAGLISLMLYFVIVVSLLKPGIMVGTILLSLFALIPIGAARLVMWSPIQKETGEGLFTYIAMKMRQKIAYGGLFASPPAKTKLNSLAVGGEDGLVVNCEQWLGTQPLPVAPPMSAYVRDYRSAMDFTPYGQAHVIRADYYDDGLGDRSLS